jgi:predicted phosphodiesterase
MTAATILHLSDLHLGASLDDTGSSEYGTVGSAFKGGSPIMQSHDSFIVAALRTEVQLAARAMGSEHDDFDFTVVTGDISTSADGDARFEFARTFLVDRVPGVGGWVFGLGLPAERTLCVPGNHDKMLESTLTRYLKGFQGLPAKPPYGVTRTARNGRTVVFYGIDSNAYRKGNIAIGEIAPTTLAWLGRELRDIDPERHDQRDPVRILLLHHHPCDLNRFRRRGLKQRFLDRAVLTRLSRLEEGDRLLDQCRGRIDVIMHGHEHFPVVFKDERSGCLVVSAGSTSEFHGTGGGNSFHGLAIDEHQIRVRQFDWTGARFAKAREWVYNRATGDLEEVIEEAPDLRSRIRAALRWLSR